MDEDQRASARNRDANTTPSTPAPPAPASADHRRAVIDGVCRGQGWRASRRDQLAHPCDCGAGPTFWCRRLGTAVVGYIHDRRGVVEPATRGEPAPV